MCKKGVYHCIINVSFFSFAEKLPPRVSYDHIMLIFVTLRHQNAEDFLKAQMLFRSPNSVGERK